MPERPVVIVHQRNGRALERAFAMPTAWTAGWRDAQPFTFDLPDMTTDAPVKQATLELLWLNGAPHIVVTRGAENLESHPMVDTLTEEGIE